MATVWSFYFREQSKQLSTVDNNGYTWTLNLPQAGTLEVQTDSPVEIARRVWKFGVKGLASRTDDVVLESGINDPTIETDGSVTDGSGIITVTEPSAEPTGA